MSSRDEIAIEGDAVTLRPKGVARFFEAAFLLVWLAFWAVGEGVALLVLGSMLMALFGFLRESGFTRLGRTVIERGPGYEIGFVFLYVFLIVWVTFWTVGGCAAWYRFLRLVAGADRLSVSGGALEMASRAGPIRRRRCVDRAQLRRIRVRPHDKALVADTISKTVTISDLGTAGERESLAEWLRGRLGLDAAARPAFDPLVAPPGWRVMRDEAGALRLSRPARGRRIAGGVVAVLTAVAVYAWSVDMALHGLSSLWPALPIGFLAVTAAWIGLAREEWLVSTHQLGYRMRLGPFARERTFRQGILEVKQTIDSDGDAHYTLIVRDASSKRTIASSTFDDAELMDCGRWLESATGFRLIRT
jgi:hypothetical protein